MRAGRAQHGRPAQPLAPSRRGLSRAAAATGAGRQALRGAGAALVLLAAGGCANLPRADVDKGREHYQAMVHPEPSVGPPNPSDPWEDVNRRIYNFNEAIDAVAVKPAALIYQQLLPPPVRKGIANVLDNMADLWSGVNMLLQAKPKAALDTGLRVGMNTVFGLGGLFDVADEAGLERLHVEDFGQTLGHWGMPSGPYVVLPLLGPSTVRDGTGLALLDLRHSGPSLVLDNGNDQLAASFIQVLNTRVKLLGATKVLDDIALDRYVLMRDAFLARRRSQVYDGNPPEDTQAPDGDAAAPTPTVR